MESKEWVLTAVKLIFAFGGVIALIAFVVLPLWRMLNTGPDPEMLNPYANVKLPEEEEEAELEIPLGGKGKMPGRAELLEMVRKDPRLTANLITKWMQEKK
jgi:flagellar biosynthesis/type III secretory pathway M-ring protein FliF/YscJ